MSSAQQLLKCNNDLFVKTTYNGVPVLKHLSDGFINVTSMCHYFNCKSKKVFEMNIWKQYLQEFQKENGTERELMYQLRKGYTAEFVGTYVDPRLVNYILFLVSPSYCLIQNSIMDTINYYGQLTEQTFDEVSRDIRSKLIGSEEETSSDSDIPANEEVPDAKDCKHLWILRTEKEGQYRIAIYLNWKPPADLVEMHYAVTTSMPGYQLIRSVCDGRWGRFTNMDDVVKRIESQFVFRRIQ